MASYTRQSTFSDGDLITAALFNDEYNQLVAAFDNATGHKHDGTVGEGPVISILGDAGLATPLNKILIDTTNDHIEFWIDVSGTSTQQLYIADGAIVPVTDNDIDLGTNSLQFKDLYINGTANIDNLAADSATLTTADINGGNIDGTVIGATTAAAGTFTTIDASGNVVISGNLTVSGTTTSVNSNEVNIGDNIIVLNSDETGTPSQNAGIEIERGTSTNVSLLWNESNDYWTFGSNDLNFPDSSKAKFGTGNDLQIYHDGTHSVIDDVGTGNLILQTNGTQITLQSSSEYFVTAQNNGAVTLYHNGSAKLATTSTGIDVTGTVVSDGLTVDNGLIYSNSTTPDIRLMESDATDQNTQIRNNAGDLQIRTLNDAQSSATLRFNLDHATGDISFYEDTGTTAKLFWDASAERLGIGTTSPNAKLTVQNGIQRINSTDGSSDARIMFSMVDGSNTPTAWVGIPNWNKDGFYIFGPTANGNETSAYYTNSTWVFNTADTERLRIDSSGNLLIGTTNDFPPGDVGNEGVAIKPDNIAISRQGSTPLFLDRMSSDGIIVDLRKDNSAIGKLRSYSSDLVVQNAGTGLRFNDGNNTIHPVVSAGSVSDNLTDLGLSNARFKDLHLGGTVNFGSLSDGTTTITGFVDEDNMSSNSATLLPTQQSVKAYVDSQISSAGGNGISFEDNEKAQFGDGNDLQIYHDASDSYIKDAGIGNLKIQAQNLSLEDSTGARFLLGIQSGETRLYYQDSQRVAVNNTGIDVTGTATMDGLTVEGLSNATATTAFSTTANTPNASLIIGNSAATTGNGNYKGGLGFAKAGTSSQIRSAIVGKQTATSNNVQGLAFLVHSSSVAGSLTEALLIKANNDIIFYDDTGTTEGLLWDASTERLAIGTTSPNAKLEISTTDGVESLRINSLDTQVTEGELIGEILFTSNDATLNADRKVLAGIKTFAAENFAGANANEASLQFFTANSNDLRNSAAPSPRMTINEDGKVGIGIAPSNPLDVAGIIRSTSTNPQLRIYTSSGTGQGYLIFGDSADDDIGQIVYNHNTDSMRFHTNASERVRIDSSGKLGVNTTSLDGILTLKQLANSDSNGLDGIRIDASTGTTYAGFGLANATGTLAITAGDAGGTENTEIVFKTASSGSEAERARIDSSGNVGIGITNPSATLHVEGDAIIKGGSGVSNTGATLQLESTETQAVGSGASISFKGDDGSGTQRVFGVIKGSKTSATSGNFNGGLDFFTRVTAEANARKRLEIASNGDISFYEDTGTSQALFWDSSAESLGIGTTSPQKKLNVFADGTAPVRFERNTSHGQVIQIYKDGAAISSIGTNSTGIGTSVPHSTARLHIQGNDGASGSTPNVAANELFIDNNGNTGVTVGTTNTGTGYYAFADSDTALRAGMFYDHSTDDMGFRVASATAITIDSSRNVGIGTSSPSNKLTVDGDIRIRDSIASLFLQDTDGTSQVSEIKQSAGVTTISSRNNTNNGDILFTGYNGTATTEYARIISSGNVGIGTSSPDNPLDIRSAGNVQLKLASTTASNNARMVFAPNNTAIANIGIDASSSAFTYYDIVNATVPFKIAQGASTNTLSINTNSQVGIGTNAPARTLHVNNNGESFIRITSSNTGNAGLEFGDQSDGVQGSIYQNATDNSLIFNGYNNAERVRITSGGEFYVGTTNGQTTNSNITTKASINGDVFTNGIRFNTNTTQDSNTAPSYKLWMDSTDLMIGSVVIETGATSDRRLKENIENIPNAIEKVKLLNGVTYNYKKKPDVKEAGFIAQDVEKALPEAVYTAYEDGEEVLALKYNRITSVLVEAMKEQQEQIESLKSEIANLKGEKNGN